MIIGIPKEIKNNENRVGATPSGVNELVKFGHTVYVQKTAGEGSGFSDEEYVEAGAKLLPTIEEIYAQSEMIYKVKEPIAVEYDLIRENQLIFTYFHFAAEEALTHAMIKQKAVCLAYETVTENNTLPLLTPMSEVAGRMAAQQGARFLEKPQGGRGVLMGGVPGVHPARVLVLGGGVVGYNAAIIAAGLGANVLIADISLPKLRLLDSILPKNIKTLFASQYNIKQELAHCDLVIGAVLVPGAKAPYLITRDMLKLMKKGSVLVDVAIDQGGCFETSRVTTHSNPVYEVDGIVHYCVANIPGAVPYTSTLALTNATLPYAIDLANKGWKRACQDNRGLAEGLNIIQGKVVYQAVANTFGLEYTPVSEFLK
ncbi:alanine dehydrogenase [Capnocytophaga canis]|uniref:Alanine dehydrogenase n=1 Tax=Capnocytophaga canis TaxID=1848903 RepID=A0A3A1YKS1_9FLAO|nr:alanine dehydrogenase [Capnocytophaga canis]RIY38265.1 alanine dehydrogenase [Capnocytophaga canis]GIM61508.1 alanine dehydrogenase [Capnocytophaga canis]